MSSFVEHAGALTRTRDQLLGGVERDGAPVALGHALHEDGQVAALLCRAGDDGVGPLRRERLVELRGLGKRVGRREHHRSRSGIGEVVHERLAHGLGKPIAPHEDHEPEVGAHGEGVERVDDGVDILLARHVALVDVEIRQTARLEAALEPRDGGIALDLIRSEHQICAQKLRRSQSDRPPIPSRRIRCAGVHSTVNPRSVPTRNPPSAGSRATSPASMVHRKRAPNSRTSATAAGSGCP